MDAQYTQGVAPFIGSYPLQIGGILDDPLGPDFFERVMDELTLYNRALSAGEIQALYNAGSAGKCRTGVSPALLSVSPNSGQQGQQTLSVTITGQNTHFVQGTTTASFGAGITVASLTVNSPTTATAVINIDPSGGRRAKNGYAYDWQGSSFSYQRVHRDRTRGHARPCVTYPEQQTAGPAEPLRESHGRFAHWAKGTTTASFGAGITVTSLTVSSPTSPTAVINIDPGRRQEDEQSRFKPVLNKSH